MKAPIKYIIPLILVSSSALVYVSIKNQAKTNSDNTLKNSSESQNSQLNQNINLQKLSVLPQKCRGCGKCVRIDPNHFEMSGQVAIVISSTNLDSSKLTLAINNCPTQAIVLE
jgi:ferredoxin